MKSKKQEKRKATQQTVAEPAKPKRWPWALAAFVTIAVIFEVYEPALSGPFLFDDNYLPFRTPGFPVGSLMAWLQGVRPLLMFSYWVNYQLSGLDTFSYHVFNVLFHALNGMLIFLIARRILEWAGVEQSRLDILAGFAGALFLLHPAQSESVGYVASRSESLSVLFFFGAWAVFLYRRSAEVTWGRTAAVLSLFGAATVTKEHTAVLPALLLLTDYFWNPGFSLKGIRRNWRLYGMIVVAAALAGLLVLNTLRGAPTAGFNIKEFTWYQYFFTQCRALWVYIRLFLFPAGQTIDYDFPISRTVVDHGAIAGLVGLLLAAGAAFYYRRRYPLAAFGFFAYVILMAPTSSFIPIQDPVAERRLYLSMIGLLFIALEFLRRWKAERTAMLAALGGVLAGAAVLTYMRNHVWTSAVALWEDTVEKSPRKVRPQFQLAHAYFTLGACDKAEVHYAIAAQLEPPDDSLLVDWGLAYDCLHKPDEALAKLRQAAALHPNAHIYSQIGMVYGKQGKNAEALEALQTAVQLNPAFEMSYVYRGGVHLAMNDPATAEADFRQAMAINPQNQSARDGLSMAEARLRGKR